LVPAATVPVAGDLDPAEEAVHDAWASALATWCARGIAANPGAWLTTAAEQLPGPAVDAGVRGG
jgi:RNA polymerase sigma-70 factor (ECF subfamily)